VAKRQLQEGIRIVVGQMYSGVVLWKSGNSSLNIVEQITTVSGCHWLTESGTRQVFGTAGFISDTGFCKHNQITSLS